MANDGRLLSEGIADHLIAPTGIKVHAIPIVKDASLAHFSADMDAAISIYVECHHHNLGGCPLLTCEASIESES
jgi:hypothetical protein